MWSRRRVIFVGIVGALAAGAAVILPRLGGWLSGDPGAYVYLPESIRAFPDQASLAAELSVAGYEKVEWKNMTGGITALHLGRKPNP